MNQPATGYTITLTRAARRGLNKVPLAAATALYEHLTGPVATNPHRLGKRLDAPYDGVWTTRRGEYRALYTINDHDKTVTVLAVDHRRDAYRPH